MAMDRTDIETGRLLSAVVTWPEAQLTEHGTACLGSFGEFGLNRLLIRETLLNARPCFSGRLGGWARQAGLAEIGEGYATQRHGIINTAGRIKREPRPRKGGVSGTAS